MKKIVFLILTLVALSACTNRGTTKNGYSFDKQDIEQIKIGVSNKETVLDLLDYPSATSQQDPNKWIYYSYKTKRLMFFKPRVIEQDVVIISFNDDNIVKDLAKYNLDNSANISPSINRTQVANKKESVVDDIINNIGSVSPGL